MECCDDIQPSFLQILVSLTKDIIETYKICNPQFHYSEELNPKRFLTSPSTGVLNDGYDNENSDLILTVNFVLVNLEMHRRFDTVTDFPSIVFPNLFILFIFKFCHLFL